MRRKDGEELHSFTFYRVNGISQKSRDPPLSIVIYSGVKLEEKSLSRELPI
jgi:hypothetical protein